MQKDVCSEKIGIRLFTEGNKETTLYAMSQQVNRWVEILTRNINVRGFHEMFKPIRKLGKGNFATVY